MSKLPISHILMIGPLPPPAGGMATSLENLVTSDLKDKYKISILDVTGYRMRRKGTIFHGIFHQIHLIFKLINLLVKEKPAIAHLQMASRSYFYRRAVDIMICKAFGVKVIFHLRGGKFRDFYEDSLLLSRSIIRFILKISDRIVILSSYWFELLADITDRGKIAVIPNGVRCSDFAPVNDKRKGLGLTGDRIIILFTGSVEREKGVFDILDIIPEVTGKDKNFYFIFCGPTIHEEELKQFKIRLTKDDIAPYAKYIEYVSGQEKIDYYLSSDIFLLPSYLENFPNSLLEAMAAALPVIATAVGAIPEMIKDGTGGFIIKPGDKAALIQHILRLGKEPELRRSMGRNNLESVRKNYDMSLIAEKTDMFYQGLLQSHV